jgi:plastocyanin
MSQRINNESMKINRHLKRLQMLVLYGLACGAFGFSFSTQGAVTNVSMVSFTYTPDAVTINVNDTVQWTYNGSLHSSTSDATPTPLWDSGVHSTGFTPFPFKFTSAGTFPYHCTTHVVTFNMRGSVTVLAAANVRPTVAITNPTNGAVLSAPATIALAATASDSDGSVANVQFFNGSASLASVTNSPYSVVVNNLGAGDYTFSAVANDNGGLSATNAIVVHVVTAVPVVLSDLQRPSPTSFQFSYSANVGLRYVVQRSGDLLGFTPISTNTAASTPVTFLDSGATGAVNFYRVGRLPNP